jgi:hypothetical protein
LGAKPKHSGLSRGVKPKSRKTVFINNFAEISHVLVYPYTPY